MRQQQKRLKPLSLSSYAAKPSSSSPDPMTSSTIRSAPLAADGAIDVEEKPVYVVGAKAPAVAMAAIAGSVV